MGAQIQTIIYPVPRWWSWTRLGCLESVSEAYLTVSLLCRLRVDIRGCISLDPEPCSCACYATTVKNNTDLVDKVPNSAAFNLKSGRHPRCCFFWHLVISSFLTSWSKVKISYQKSIADQPGQSKEIDHLVRLGYSLLVIPKCTVTTNT